MSANEPAAEELIVISPSPTKEQGAPEQQQEHEQGRQQNDQQQEQTETEGGEGGESTAVVEMKSYDKAREAFRHRDLDAAKAEHAKKSDHVETHGGVGSEYVKAIVFGGLDGIVTTFAIIAAAAGSGEDWRTVLIFGFANVLADAFSMGFGEFVSGTAEREYALGERGREEWEVDNCIEMEIKEMEDLYVEKGLSEDDAKTVIGVLSKNKRIFVDFMMVEELGLLIDVDDKYGSLKQGGVMFLSFLFFGVIPLLAYLGGSGKGLDYVFGISVGLTAISLLVLGAVKGYLTGLSVLFGALLMLINGSISGGLSFGVGVLVDYIVSNI